MKCVTTSDKKTIRFLFLRKKVWRIVLLKQCDVVGYSTFIIYFLPCDNQPINLSQFSSVTNVHTSVMTYFSFSSHDGQYYFRPLLMIFHKLFIGFASWLFADLLRTSTFSLSNSFVHFATECKAGSCTKINLLSLNLFSVYMRRKWVRTSWLATALTDHFEKYIYPTSVTNIQRKPSQIEGILQCLHAHGYRIFRVTFLSAGEAISEWNTKLWFLTENDFIPLMSSLIWWFLPGLNSSALN